MNKRFNPYDLNDVTNVDKFIERNKYKQINKEEIKKYLKENLSITFKEDSDYFGTDEIKKLTGYNVTVLLEKEEILDFYFRLQ